MSLDNFKSVAECSSDGILLIDENFNINFANHIFLTYFHFTDLIGKPMFVLMSYKSAQKHKNIDPEQNLPKKKLMPVVHGNGATTTEICTVIKVGSGWVFIVNFEGSPTQKIERRKTYRVPDDDALSEITISTGV